MSRLLLFLTAGALFVGFSAGSSVASDNPMYDFYSGLIEVIENNTDNPQACMAQAKSYIRSNIGPLQKVAE